MNLRTVCMVTITALLLAGCASPASRIADKQSVYDSYPPEVRSRIAAGQVDVGFTPEQAELALGKPTRKYSRTTAKGTSEVWAYTKTRPSFSFGVGGGFGIGSGGFGSVGIGTGTAGEDPEDKLRLVFEDGKITAVEQAVK